MSIFDLGSFSGNQNYSGIVDSNEPFDLYKFNISHPGIFQLSLNGLNANANVQLLSNTGNVLWSSELQGINPEAISVDNLAAGSYAVRVFTLGEATNYNLSLTVDPLTGMPVESGQFEAESTGNILNPPQEADNLTASNQPLLVGNDTAINPEEILTAPLILSSADSEDPVPIPIVDDVAPQQSAPPLDAASPNSNQSVSETVALDPNPIVTPTSSSAYTDEEGTTVAQAAFENSFFVSPEESQNETTSSAPSPAIDPIENSVSSSTTPSEASVVSAATSENNINSSSSLMAGTGETTYNSAIAPSNSVTIVTSSEPNATEEAAAPVTTSADVTVTPTNSGSTEADTSTSTAIATENLVVTESTGTTSVSPDELEPADEQARVENSNPIEQSEVTMTSLANGGEGVAQALTVEDTATVPTALALSQMPAVDEETVTITDAVEEENLALTSQPEFSEATSNISSFSFAQSTSSNSPNSTSPTGPDLVISPLLFPTTAVAGTSYQFSWSVTNQGNEAASGDPWWRGWYDAVYLSDNTVWDTSDIRVERDIWRSAQTPLAAGDSYTVTSTLELPDNAPAGLWYLLFVTDNYSYQIETRETNNVTAAPIPINITVPDLIVDRVTAPTMAAAGQSIPVSITVKNQGTVLAAGDWYDAVYLSNDAILDNSDTRYTFWDSWNQPPLAPGQEYTLTQNINLSSSTASGTRYLIFAADASTNQSEINETNNLKIVPITITGTGADLIVDPNGINAPSTIAVGNTASFSWRVRNQGDAPTRNGWYDSIYLSDDTTFDSGDTKIAETYRWWQGANSDYEVIQNNITIPTTKLGNRFLLFVTDDRANEGESNETNNVVARPVEVKAADLAVQGQLNAPQAAISSQKITVSWTVKNEGNAATPSNIWGWSDVLYLSDDSILDERDTQIISEGSSYYTNYQPLTPGASYTVTRNDITLPSTGPGTRYLLLATDRWNSFNEASETNNVLVHQIQISAPDLVVGSATAPRTAALGDSINVSWNVTNRGDVPTVVDWWQDYIYVSDDAILDRSIDRLIGSRGTTYRPSLAPNASYPVEANTSITLPNNLAPGNRYLLFVADGNLSQGETNETNNVRAVEIDIKAPDLTTTARTTPANANPGESIAITWTIQNQGDAAAARWSNWYDEIYFSTDPFYDTSDTPLLQEWRNNQNPLAVNETYNYTINRILPNTGAGQRYLLFITDRYNNQGETNEANNIEVVPITINGQNADLTLNVLNAPNEAVLGQQISVQWQVTNEGNLATNGNSWYDRVYLSNDRFLDRNSDTPLTSTWSSSYISNPSLAVGANYTVAPQTFWIPSGAAVGDRFLLFVTDDWNNQSETNEANNVVARQIKLTAPDLFITDVTAPQQALPGGLIEVEWTVKNQGDAAAIISWSTDSIYLSTDDKFDPNKDINLKDISTRSIRPLEVNDTYEIQQILSLPNNIDIGSYHLLFIADRTQSQPESNENNNIRAVPIQLGLVQPDLFITEAAAPSVAALGETIEVRWQVKNQGNLVASNSWYDAIYISDDRQLDANDKLIPTQGTTRNSPLTPNNSYEFVRNIEIPNTQIGTRYLLFVADAGNTQGESNEGNNVKSLEITLQAPDLIVSQVTAPSVATWGETIEVSWRVKNQSSVTAAKNWLDRVYLSDDDTLDSNDRPLGFLPTGNKTPLAPNGEYQQNLNIQILPNVGIGRKYLLFVADDDNEQGETNNANNVRALDIAIKASNLQVTATNAPSQVTWGEALNLSWTVTNVGTGAALTSEWDDFVYLSSDATLDANDTPLGWPQRVSNTTRLPATGAYTLNQDITIPTVAPGEWYLLFAPDRNNAQPETSESDNVLPVRIEVKAPDLAVADVNAAGAGIWGQNLPVSWRVNNIGTGTAIRGWWDGVFLSSNPTYERWSDQNLNYQWAGERIPLAAGNGYPISANINIPTVTPGNYYLLFVTNTENSSVETNQTNNVIAQPFQVIAAPDLVPTITSSPNTATSGTTVSLEWSVTNRGGISAPGNWIDRIYLSTDDVFNSGDLPLASLNRTSSLSPNSKYDARLDFELPIDASGNRYLLLVTDADRQVEETGNEDNNVVATPIQIALAPYADLTVTDVNAPTVTVGDPASVTIEWTVANIGVGTGSVNTWIDRIIASTDDILGNGNDITLGEFARTGLLNVNESYTRTETLSLRPGFEGRYRLFVQTDATGRVFENGNEANNAATASNFFDVARTPFSDLKVSTVQTPNRGASGQPLTVSWTVENQGVAITNINSWYDRISLATDPEGRNIVDDLGIFNRIGALAPGDNYKRDVEVILPNGISGNYYFVVNTWGPYEFIHTNNNTLVSNAVEVTLTPSPDLVVRDITAPNAVFSGDRIDVSWTVANEGTGNATSTWVDRVFLREAGNPNGRTIPLGLFTFNSELLAGKFIRRTEQFTLPSNLQGLYEVVVTTNATNTLYEQGGAANNTAVDDNPMQVSYAPRPDLRVDRIFAPQTVAAGSTISVEFDIINQGTLATTVPKWKDNVYLSLDSQISSDDILLASLDNSAALTEGEVYTSRTNPTVVPKQLRGQVFLIVQTDANNAVNEFPQENNNIQAIQLNVTPLAPSDLAVTNVAAPTLAFEGSEIEVRYTVKNLGIGETDRDSWTDTIWLTRDKNRPSPTNREGQSEDILLTSFTRNGSLLPNGEFERVAKVRLPDFITGEWYITPWTDAGDAVLEDTRLENTNPDDPNQIGSMSSLHAIALSREQEEKC